MGIWNVTQKPAEQPKACTAPQAPIRSDSFTGPEVELVTRAKSRIDLGCYPDKEDPKFSTNTVTLLMKEPAAIINRERWEVVVDNDKRAAYLHVTDMRPARDTADINSRAGWYFLGDYEPPINSARKYSNDASYFG